MHQSPRQNGERKAEDMIYFDHVKYSLELCPQTKLKVAIFAIEQLKHTHKKEAYKKLLMFIAVGYTSF